MRAPVPIAFGLEVVVWGNLAGCTLLAACVLVFVAVMHAPDSRWHTTAQMNQYVSMSSCARDAVPRIPARATFPTN